MNHSGSYLLKLDASWAYCKTMQIHSGMRCHITLALEELVWLVGILQQMQVGLNWSRTTLFMRIVLDSKRFFPMARYSTTWLQWGRTTQATTSSISSLALKAHSVSLPNVLCCVSRCHQTEVLPCLHVTHLKVYLKSWRLPASNLALAYQLLNSSTEKHANYYAKSILRMQSSRLRNTINFTY